MYFSNRTYIDGIQWFCYEKNLKFYNANKCNTIILSKIPLLTLYIYIFSIPTNKLIGFISYIKRTIL